MCILLYLQILFQIQTEYNTNISPFVIFNYKNTCTPNLCIQIQLQIYISTQPWVTDTLYIDICTLDYTMYIDVGTLFDALYVPDMGSNTLKCMRRPSKTTQPLVRADRPKTPSKLTVRGPFVYRDQILLLN